MTRECSNRRAGPVDRWYLSDGVCFLLVLLFLLVGLQHGLDGVHSLRIVKGHDVGWHSLTGLNLCNGMIGGGVHDNNNNFL